MFPHFIWQIATVHISQTLLTSFLGLFFFVIFTIIYQIARKYFPHSGFVLLVDDAIGSYMEFVDNIAPELSSRAKIVPIFLFFYILRNNILWVFIDMFAGIPWIHHHFRPVTTDVFFNLVLAIVWVIWALIYGTIHWWRHFREKYFPIYGIGIVPKVHSVGTFIGRIFDVFLWFFVGLLELVWEIAKMISLSLRLFGNILAGVVLLWLWIAGGTLLGQLVFWLDIPLVLPLLVLLMELFVGTLQSFVFSLLVIVYFKISAVAH